MSDILSNIIDEEVEQEGFIIDDDSKAEWALGKISISRHESEKYIEICESMIQKYKMKISESERKYEEKTSFLGGQLREYFETVEKKSTKSQDTFKLPSGTLKLRHPKVKFERDDQVFVKWLKENKFSKFITIKESPKWGEFKKVVDIKDGVITKDGKSVEGISTYMSEPEFIVDVKGVA